jgi:GNAT superfamily N-acetyltransferase
MKMWRPDKVVQGPRRATAADIGALNRVFSESFTDRYRRDGLVGVRVPQLNPQIWRYALDDAGAGAMVWTDEKTDIVAFNIAHRSGREGWMGPLAVRPDRQGLGLGKSIVRSCIDWLKDDGATIIGLETMPRTVENVGFYSGLGFVPGHLTVTLTLDLTSHNMRGPYIRLSQLAGGAQAALLARLRVRLERSAPAWDFTREHELTESLGIGETIVVERDGEISGFALAHAAPLADQRPGDELRVLKLYAESDDAFDRVMTALELLAGKLKLRRIAIRCQTAYGWAYRQLLARAYRVRWTDLRMTLEGYQETMLTGGQVLFSNWEI